MAEIKVITIGRHYCAGGSTIGKIVAEKLGIPCYDREIIDMAAQKSGIAMSEIQKYEEAVGLLHKSRISACSLHRRIPYIISIYLLLFRLCRCFGLGAFSAEQTHKISPFFIGMMI